MDTPNQQPNSSGPTQKLGAPGEKNTLMGVLSYISILVVIPLLVAKDDPFVKFHIKQGLVLLVIEVAVWVVGTMIWPLMMFLNLINLAAFVLAIIGIINVVKGLEKELPFVGKYSKYATF
jgi:uncharacterized membrane protein